MPGPLPAEPPLTPSADEARAWAEAELSKAIYQQGESLWDRFLGWLADLWERLLASDSVLGPVLLPVVVLLVVALLVGLAFLLGGPIRRRRLAAAASGADLLDDDARTAAQLRAAADAAAAAGDHSRAVLERFRALVRALDERAVLEDRRGRTAHEAAAAAGARLPSCAKELRRAGELFDGVCYGGTVAGPAEDGWLAELDRAVARTRPTRTGDLAHDELVAPQ